MTRLILFVCAISITVIACSTNGSDVAMVMPQKRAAWELLRHADPATGTIPENVRLRELRFAASMPGALGTTMRDGERAQAATWTNRGPWNVGGRTRAMALDVTNERTILAGGVSAGMWRSDDAGATWTRTTAPDQLHSVSSVAQDIRPGKTQTWYYSTGEIWGNSAQISGNGVFKSTNGGRSWVVLPSTVEARTVAQGPFAYTWRIATNPASTTDEVYVATARSGIYRSTDGGATWSSVLASTSLFSDVVITSKGVIYAALSKYNGYVNDTARTWGIFRSTNGTSWTKISPADMPASVNRIVLGVAPGDEEQVWAIAETPGSGAKGVFVLSYETREEWHSLWKYTHGTWSNRSANIPLFGGRNGDFFSQGGYDLYVRVHPTDTNLVFVGGTSIYRSTNGFTSPTATSWIGGYWSQQLPTERYPSYPVHHPDQHELIFLPSDPRVMLSCNDGGLWRTMDLRADTVAWEDLNRGYVSTQFYTVNIVQKAADDRIIGGMQDNGTFSTESADGSTTWTRRNGGDGSFVEYVQGGKEVYASSQQGIVRRIIYNDAGVEVARTRIDPIGAKNYLFINPFRTDPLDDRVLYVAGGAMLWRNRDVSAIPLGRTDSTSVNWDSLPRTRLSSGQISAIAVLREPRHTVIYGTSNGVLYRLDNANDTASVPKVISASPFPKGAYVSSIAVDSASADHVVVALSNYNVMSVVATTDGGATWQAVGGNLEQTAGGTGDGPAVNSVAIMRYNDTTMIYVAATSTGVYTTTQLNGGSTVWTQSGATTVGTVPCEMAIARNADKTMVVASHGAGMYAGTVTDLPPLPPSPTLLSPANRKRGVSADRLFAWQRVNGAVSYTLEVATDETFSTDLKRIEGIRDDTARVTGLIQGPVTYYWRVFAFGEGGRSQPSETWQFSTAIRPPVLLLPATNTSNVPGNPVSVVWERVPGAVSYDLQTSTVLTFQTIAHERTGITDTAYAIPLLESSRRYYWKVRAVDADTAGQYSARFSFVTGVLTSVDDDAAAPSWCELGATTVSTSATLRLHLRQRMPVRISLVSMNGTVRGLYNEPSDAGDHEITLRCDDVAQGSYQLVVEAGAERCTHSVIVRR